MARIPQTDPGAGYLADKAAIDAAIARVLEGGRYVLGPEVEGFEREFAAYVGAGWAVGVASGTDALVLGLKALGIGRGDGVVTVSHTAVATVAAIELAGAIPILVDVEPDSFTLDPAGLAAALERPAAPVKAVAPVHLYGQPAAMAQIGRLAAEAGAVVLEDAAQAHGASLDGRRAGAFGAAAAFSLYPTKNLAALGDAGVITTDDEALAERLRRLRQYGWGEDRLSATPGMNSRLDELQAAILRVRLARLDQHNARRIAIARAYDEGLAGLALTLPAARRAAVHVYHQYVVRTPGRDRLRAKLSELGIATAVHYPAPVHLQEAYRGRLPIGPGGLAVTERLAGEILSLPIHPQMEETAVQQVIEAVRQAVG